MEKKSNTKPHMPTEKTNRLTQTHQTKDVEPNFDKTLVGDQAIDFGKVRKELHSDFRNAREFFLDGERSNQLKEMPPLQRTFKTISWMLKAMLGKLTMVRRFLLMTAIILQFLFYADIYIWGPFSLETIARFLGGMILLFVFMLELKDKLTAQDELAAGRTVQVALMPKSRPQIPGWDTFLYSRPANDVGGDLVDFIQMENNRYGLVLGDVAGKGLPAALLMVKLQATLRAMVTEFDNLAHMAQKVNHIFHRDSMTRSFASLVYLQLSPDSGEVKLLNAGHMPPLVIRKGSVISTNKGDVALGLAKNPPPYKEHTLQLHTDDFLIIYSDGVTEAQNEQNEFFGLERLENLLTRMNRGSAIETGTRILSQVSRFVGDAPQHDDLSLIVLKRTKKH